MTSIPADDLPRGPDAAAAGPPAVAEPPRAPVLAPDDYLNTDYSVRSWLLTVDHKRIGILYLVAITFFFLIGGIYAAVIRLELATPESDFLQPQTYNKVFTLHGVIMIFFFLIPSIPATIGNFILPMMIGARDLAFPKLNLLSWYLFMIGGVIAIVMIIMGGVDTGWTFYTPYSTAFARDWVVLTVVGIFINGFSSILTGVNFIATVHTMRAPGLRWFRLPLFVWSLYATSIIFVLGTPVVAITLALVGLERLFQIGIFDPNLGGDPVLYQHLFWFYSHPAVYIMVLPAFGVMSELVAAFTRRRIFGYAVVAMASLAIATVGFVVWGHHMFTSTQSVYAGMVFSFLSFVIAVPSAIKIFNWTATMWRASVAFLTPMLYAWFFMGLFTLGGLTGMFLAAMAVDVHVHDTYFVVAHFHYIMVGGTVLAYLGGLHYWWPKITGRMYTEWIAKFAAFTVFIGFNLTFFPQFILGYLGMPRRYAAYPPEFQVLHVMSSAGASILAIGLVLPLFYLLWSLRYAKRAGPNPWKAVGLEWTTPSPPPTENFKRTPVVTWEAYEYTNPNAFVVIGAGPDDKTPPV